MMCPNSTFLAWLREHGQGFEKVYGTAFFSCPGRLCSGSRSAFSLLVSFNLQVKIDDDGTGGNCLVAIQDLAEGEIIGLLPYNMTMSQYGVQVSSQSC